MTIRCRCPTCRGTLDAADDQAGNKVPCPACGQRLEIPPNPRTKTVLATAEPAVVPVLSLADDPLPTTARRCDLHCRECGYSGRADREKRTSDLGWVLFGVFLVFFFPVAILGLFLRDTWEVCPECGYLGRKLEGPTLG